MEGNKFMETPLIDPLKRREAPPFGLYFLSICTILYCLYAIVEAPSSYVEKEELARRITEVHEMENAALERPGLLLASRVLESYTTGVWVDFLLAVLAVIKIIAVFMILRFLKAGFFIYLISDIIVLALIIYSTIMDGYLSEAIESLPLAGPAYFFRDQGALVLDFLGIFDFSGTFWIDVSVVFSVSFTAGYGYILRKKDWN